MIRQVFEKHPHWQEVREICVKIQKSGFKALIAGGAVRDGIIGRLPKDFDIATDALPDQISAIFPDARDVGKHFGVMLIPLVTDEGESVEVATFRTDGPYLDGRRPSSVTFTDPLHDAERRDFTINALFYDPKKNEIIDYVGGREDIEKQLIRAVGDPRRRFEEDKLRILRAARFVSQLGYAIDEQTTVAAKELADQVSVVSQERITEEFRKLATGSHLKNALTTMRDLGLFDSVLSQLTFVRERDDLWLATLRSAPFLAAVRSFQLFMGWMVLQEALHRNFGHRDIRGFCESLPLRLTRDDLRDIEYLTRGFMDIRDGKKSSFLLLADERGPLMTELCSLAAMNQLIPEERIAAVIDEFLFVVDENGELAPPLVRGDDLLALGFEPTSLKTILEDIYIVQLKERISDREKLLQAARERRKV